MITAWSGDEVIHDKAGGVPYPESESVCWLKEKKKKKKLKSTVCS